MKSVRLAAGILNQTPLDWDGNVFRVRQAIQLAQADGVSALCLPELCLSGYGCEDMFLSPNTWQPSWQCLEELVPQTEGLIVTLGLPLYVTNGVYNVVCVVADQRILGFVPKQHLAGDGLHYEPRWFRSWPQEIASEYRHGSEAWPIGDLMFEIDGIRFGFEICEDAWVADRPGRKMAECGVDVILNPSASHFAFGKHEIRKRFVLEGSRAFGCSYVYSNLVGNEAGRAIYDGGGLIAAAGELVATGKRFGFQPVKLVAANLDVERSRSQRASVYAMETNVSDDIFDRIVFHDTQLGLTNSVVPSASLNTVVAEVVPTEADEFTQAISLALFDYLRKSYSRGFVVSMSGGADSSAVAVLIRCAIVSAVADLGLNGVKSSLGYIADIQTAQNTNDLMFHLFTGVYQATRNSGSVTRNAAEAVTKGVGGCYHELDIDSLVQGYTEVVERAIKRSLTWDTDDITLQNIQARTRSPSIWMFANIKNALLLSTSNRSEAAVGYATMDGDTSGGLSPIAGIDKAFLRQWLRIMQTDGSGNCEPVAALSFVNAQQPTAELRPAEYDQTDEGDLMPYPLLDEIESLAIGEKRGPKDVFHILQDRHPEHSSEQLKQWVKKFFQLWCRNQWKRERYAPSFHVDDKNLDPRTWCRFPILSGGFQRELEQL